MKMPAMVISLLVLNLSPVFASEERRERPCDKDIKTYCKDVQPGDGRIVKCLNDNKDKVDSECRTSMDKKEEHMKKMQELRQACEDDRKKHCDGKEGRGQVHECLVEHQDSLSADCKEKMKEAKEHRDEKREKRRENREEKRDVK